jgi:cytochrome c-type biogenesis protein CcmH/NrfG
MTTTPGARDRAAADYDQAIRIDPKNAVFYSYRGEAFEARNDPDRTLADFD